MHARELLPAPPLNVPTCSGQGTCWHPQPLPSLRLCQLSFRLELFFPSRESGECLPPRFPTSPMCMCPWGMELNMKMLTGPPLFLLPYIPLLPHLADPQVHPCLLKGDPRPVGFSCNVQEKSAIYCVATLRVFSGHIYAGNQQLTSLFNFTCVNCQELATPERKD